MAKTITKVKLDGGKVRYRVKVYMGTDPNRISPKTGDPMQQWAGGTFNTKREAEDEVARLMLKKGQGFHVAPGKEPLREFLPRWLEVKGPELDPGTLDDYKGVADRYVINPKAKDAPTLGAREIGKLRPDHFQELYTYYWKAGKGVGTLRHIHRVLRQALGYAVKMGLLHRNPTDHVKVPSRARDGEERREVIRAMSQEEAMRFSRAAKADLHHALWVVLLTGGLRPGEALGLLWDDVDLEGGKLHIRRALSRRGIEKEKREARKGDAWRLKAPKTKKSRRVVPLPAAAMQALREHRRRHAEYRLKAGSEYGAHSEGGGFVFCTPFGRPLDLDNLYDNFNRICRAAGLGEEGPLPDKPLRGPRAKPKFRPAFRIYDLRHTCATLLLRAGVNPKIVQERLGHASITLTLDTYSHVLPDMQEVAVEAFDQMFGGEGAA